MKKIISILGASLLMSGQAQSAQVFVTDLVVQGSTCSGFDCVNGESFGFDTIRLKENNLRIHFDDTSTSSSFPRNDWRLIANDTSNGGGNYFAIEDSTAGRIPFRVDAGAPADSIRVTSSGNVGIGTSSPIVEQHIVDGDSPTIRLEQDGSSGFTAQTWDVAGNEANFFVRDATNGSKLPFRIRPNSPSDSIDITTSGVKIKNIAIPVGVGTDSPEDDLHVSDGGPARIRLTNTTKIASATEDPDWVLNSNGTFRISSGIDGAELKLDSAGNLIILGSLTTAGSTCSGGCDLVFSKEYNLPTIEEHAAEMWKKSHLPAVGPTVENAPFNISKKTGAMLNELEKAHIYINQLNDRIKIKEKELSLVKAQFSDLEQRLSKLEK